MRPVYWMIPALYVLSFLIFSCGKATNQTTCNIDYSVPALLTADQQVQYFAASSGSATVSSLTYQDSTGMTTVQHPALPFQVKVNLKKGAKVMISLMGSASQGGHIAISALADGNQSGLSCDN